MNLNGNVKITTGAASAIGNFFKIILKIGGVLILLTILALGIGLIIENKSTQERNVKLSQSWVKPPNWTSEDEAMLKDCYSRKSWNSRVPALWDEDKKYVSSFVTRDGLNKVIIYSGKPIVDNFYNNPPKAFEGQAIMCQYNLSTQAFVGSIYSMDGKWQND